ncbi:MAG: hypothetical protein EXR52_05930 [Dehalococcoidia bacterium]|nr:hypothetical protein [Dehalococcoidia bacterium]
MTTLVPGQGPSAGVAHKPEAESRKEGIAMRRNPIILTSLLAFSGAFAVACSGGSAAGGGATEVKVKLSEFKYEGMPAQLKAGQAYKFVLTNAGTVEHEFSVVKRGNKDHGGALAAVEAKELQPGKSVTKEFTFNQKGDFEVACHVPAHYEAGMKMAITIS